MKFKPFILNISLCVIMVNAMAQTWEYGETYQPEMSIMPHVSFKQAMNGGYQLHLNNRGKFEILNIDSSLQIDTILRSKEPSSLMYHYLRSVPIDDGWLHFAIEKHLILESKLFAVRQTRLKSDTVLLGRINESFVPESEIHFSRSNGRILIWFEWKRSPRVHREEITVIDLDPISLEIDTDTLYPDHSNELISYDRCWKDGENILLAGRLYDISPIEKRAGKPNYVYCLSTYNRSEDSTTTTELTDKSLFFNRMRIVRNDSGYLFAFLFSTKNNYTEGVIVYQYSSQTRMVWPIYARQIDLPGKYRRSYTYDRFRKKVRNLWIDDLWTDPDGSINISLEFIESRIVQGYIGNASEKYVFGPAIIIQEMDSVEIKDKLQVSLNDGGRYSSFVLGDHTGQHFLMMNEMHKPHRKRTFLGNLRMLNHKSDYILLTLGQDSKHYLLRENRFDKMMPIPGSIRWEDETTFVVLLQHHKKMMVARCKLGFKP